MYKIPENAQKMCFYFEMVFPNPGNHVIVVHEKSRLILTGARNLETFAEIYPEDGFNQICTIYPAEMSKKGYVSPNVENRLNVNRREQIAKVLAGKNPLKFEGYVICDNNFNRIFARAPAHEALTGLDPAIPADAGNNKTCVMTLVVHQVPEEFLKIEKFAFITKYFLQIKQNYVESCDLLRNAVEKMKHLEKREFALATKKYSARYSVVLFKLKNCGLSLERYLQLAPQKAIEGLLDVEK